MRHDLHEPLLDHPFYDCLHVPVSSRGSKSHFATCGWWCSHVSSILRDQLRIRLSVAFAKRRARRGGQNALFRGTRCARSFSSLSIGPFRTQRFRVRLEFPFAFDWGSAFPVRSPWGRTVPIGSMGLFPDP
eukprot:scaffold240_cov369-Pavlova_lutheri.AAC.15